MREYRITKSTMTDYASYLREEDHAAGTIEKYLRDIQSLATWLDGRPITKENLLKWKGHLQSGSYAAVTVNSMLAAANSYLRFLGFSYRLKFLKIQRRIFRDASRELSRREYDLLVATAKKRGEDRLALLMEAICATGIRVSEVKYLTVEAARRGQTEIALKGKIRVIMLSNKLCGKLLKYARKKKITSGEIFITRGGSSLCRTQIWSEMKRLCEQAGVAPEKVFPHNLRHLFARVFYQVCRDIVKLADVLGHSSIETTRIYLTTSGHEHKMQLNLLNLVT